MSKPDGVIRFRTEADNSELEKQLEDAKKKVESVEGKIKELNKDRTSALKEQQKAQEKLNKAQAEQAEVEKKVEQANERAGEAKERLVAAQEKLNQIQREKAGFDDAKTGSFNPDTAFDAQDFVENYKTKDEWEEALKAAKSEVTELEKELKIAERTAGRFGEKLLEVDSNVENATADLQNAQTAVNNIDASISSANSELEEAEINAGNLGNQFKAAEEKSRRLQKPIESASKSVNTFMKRLKRMALNAAVFSVIAKGLSALKDRISDGIKSSEEATRALSQLKGAVNVAARPIIETLIPAVTALAQALTRAIVLVGNLFGKDFIKNASAAAAAIDKVGKAKRSLAGFDEINVMSNNEDDNGTSASYDFDSGITSEVKSELDGLLTIIAGAALVIGCILCFTGNIGYGIALMAMGAVVLVAEVAVTWGAVDGSVSSVLQALMITIGSALFVLGVILLFAGFIPLGIAAIIAGAAFMAVALNWNAVSEALQTPLGAVVGLLVGAVLVAIGILLCCGGALPLGIGLIAVGAVALGTVVALNWNAIIDALQGPLGLIIGIISAALLVIGVILLFTGVGIPLGLGLIAAGVVGLVAAIAPNWDSIVSSVEEAVNKALEWVKTYGMLILGVLLCCTGVGLPSGIYLIYDWAKKNTGSIPLAGKILSVIQTIWNSVKSFWNKYIAPIFTKKFWLDLAKKCGNGLISGFEDAINGIISMFEKMINWIVSGLNKISFDVPDWIPGIGGKKFGFDIPEVSFGRVSIPRLAQGAVLPANQPFLAMVGDQKYGTNVEAPLSVIQEAVAEVMGDMLPAMVAGFEALLEENQRLRAAVEGIEVGDSTIGQAANRYNQRMAIIRG